LLATQAGDVELRIPKLRKGSYFPVILEPRRRIDQALWAVAMEAHVCGVSTRSVDDLVAALGIGLRPTLTPAAGRRPKTASSSADEEGIRQNQVFTVSGDCRGDRAPNPRGRHFHQRRRRDPPRRRRSRRHARRMAIRERCYLSEGSMALLKPNGDTGTIAGIDSGE
jgi:Transposase, Mutator family